MPSKVKKSEAAGVSVNDEIYDRLVAHASDLTRVEAHLQARALRMLKGLEVDLLSALTRVDPTGVTRTAYQQARLEKLLDQVRETIRTAYGQQKKAHEADLRELAAVEGEFSAGVLTLSLPQIKGITVKAIGVEQLEVLAGDTLIDGASTSEWWAKQAGDVQERFKRAMRQGMMQGEDLGKLIQRVRGTKAGGFKDGLMRTTRQNAETLVRSSVQAVANKAREKVWEANQDILAGVIWISTLDNRTSAPCMARSHLRYSLPDHKPMGHNVPWGPGPGALHPRCRSTSCPVTKSWKELGINAEEISEGTQSSMDGYVPASMTYEGWLRGKPAAFQDQVLGKGKAKLWREGKIGMRDLLDNRGRPLTLEELRQKVRGADA